MSSGWLAAESAVLAAYVVAELTLPYTRGSPAAQLIETGAHQ